MPIAVYDYRTDVRNVVIMPDIRSRFLRMEPGEVGPRHSHDLGQEVFLILEGQCEFEIEGEYAVLGPGQMCFAEANQMHQVRTIGDQPMTMYLSVTPHIDPTHTFWNEDGEKLPPRYGGLAVGERERILGDQEAAEKVVGRYLAAVQALASIATAGAASQTEAAGGLLAALGAGDAIATKAAVDAMSSAVLEAYQAVRDMGASWNEIAATVADPTL